MVTVVRNGGLLHMYINGVLHGYSNIGTDPLADYAIPLRLGGQNTAGTNYLNGLLDETVVLTSALDPNQVANLYNIGANNTAAPTSITVTVAESSTTVSSATVKFTIGDCGGNTNYTITTSATPPAPGAITTPCTESVGGASYGALTNGSNSLYFYFGDGATTVNSGPSFTITRSP